MRYPELKAAFQAHERSGRGGHLHAVLVFAQENGGACPRLSRSYIISSGSEAFRPGMCGRSICGSRLDGKDEHIRLEQYIKDEAGRDDAWEVEDCYILEHMRDVAAIRSCQQTGQGDGTIAFHFGDTAIRARVSPSRGACRLMPVCGDQVACGEWNDLEIDQVAAYCVLIQESLGQRKKEGTNLAR